MIARSTIFLLFVLSICNGGTTFYEDCRNDTIDFATKVENSSFVVYGKSIGKTLDEGSDSTFHVQFQVFCIFKGSVMERQINITQAGQVEGKTYCQDFPVGRGYSIAFLEPNPLNVNDTYTFIPADFVEVPFETNVTDEVLANTCGLHHLLPINSSASMDDVCPMVSTNPKCVSFYHDLTSLDSAFDGIRSKSGSIQVDVDARGGVNSMNISILLILMAILFIQLN